MEFLGIILITLGGIICSLGAFGFYKMPDLYTKMHAIGVNDSCGCMITLIGIILINGFNILFFKLLLLLCILLIMNATSTNIILRAAAITNTKPLLGKIKTMRKNG
jgi:multicomponent Na+:H+ antiporter subunit G